MGNVSSALQDSHRAFLAAQKVFFVATAPSGAGGHVNCSPKGYDSFRIVDDTTVAYLDFVGSGIETVAHVRDNGRICVMFCAFEGKPKIVRLYGVGTVVEPGDAAWSQLRALFPDDSQAAERAIVQIRLTRVADSCGYGVPLYDFVGERDQMTGWRDRKGDVGVHEYVRRKNLRSLDGLPALTRVPDASGDPDTAP